MFIPGCTEGCSAVHGVGIGLRTKRITRDESQHNDEHNKQVSQEYEAHPTKQGWEV